MKKFVTLFLILIMTQSVYSELPSGKEILDAIDKNLSSTSRIFTSQMVIHGRRVSRTITSRSWSRGEDESFTEYLSPARERGTKMLKLEDKLWMYSPSTDRTIQISGHMLRQSVMGSDLSYEDFLEDSKLIDYYDANVTKVDTLRGRDCWLLELIAKTPDVAYHKRKMWIDQEHVVPLRSELYAKSGKLLKRTEMSNIQKIQGRWFPMTILFKDVLKNGKGTEFIITEINFDAKIPKRIFSKAALRK